MYFLLHKFEDEVNYFKECKMEQFDFGKNSVTTAKGWKKSWSEVKNMFHNYCKSTSMHGFQNIIASELSFIEKCIWAIICFLSVIFCLILMVLSYQSTQDRLTLIQITNRDTSIYTLNFPAVTICNFNKIYKPAADEIGEKLSRLGYDDKEINNFFRNLPLLNRPRQIEIDHKKFDKMVHLLGIDLRNLMAQLMQPCEKMLKYCSWNGVSYNCSMLFKRVDSLMGHCCGFNSNVHETYADLNYSSQCTEYYNEHNPDKDFQCNKETECPGRKSVLKTPGSGKDVGLSVTFDIEPEMYKGSIRTGVGAAVIIHESKDYPDTGIMRSIVQPNQELDISISGTDIVGKEGLEKLPPAESKCVFTMGTRFVNSYHSCISGCKMRRFLGACNCIPYNYPSTCNNISGICNFKNIKCIQKYRLEISQLYAEIKLDNGKTLGTCFCEPTCNRTYHVMSTDKIPRSIPKNSSFWRRFGTEKKSWAKINVYSQEYGHVQYEMSLFMSWTDLIANFGDLIGLCLGGSFITLMEPIVYLLLTPLRRVHRHKIRQTEEETKINVGKKTKKHFENLQNNQNNIFTIQYNMNKNGIRRHEPVKIYDGHCKFGQGPTNIAIT